MTKKVKHTSDRRPNAGVVLGARFEYFCSCRSNVCHVAEFLLNQMRNTIKEAMKMGGAWRNFVLILQNKARFQSGRRSSESRNVLEFPRPKDGSDVMRKQPFCVGPLIRGEITTRA